jgi:hypothetical protein
MSGYKTDTMLFREHANFPEFIVTALTCNREVQSLNNRDLSEELRAGLLGLSENTDRYEGCSQNTLLLTWAAAS